MSSDDEITALTKVPDSEDEMTRIMTEVLQPRRTHPTELLGAFSDLESALEFVRHQLMTVDQARTDEPPTQPTELSAVTDSIVITTRRVPPQTGSIVPYESSAVSEFDVNHTAGAELQAPSAEADPYQIAVPVCQDLPAFPTHQLGECSAQPAQSPDVSAYLVDDNPVTPEDLDEFHAAQEYISESTAIPDSETSHSASEFHDLTASSVVDHPNTAALTHAVPDATEEAMHLPHQPIATSQFEANASEFSNLTGNPMALFAATEEQDDVQVHTSSGSIEANAFEFSNLTGNPMALFAATEEQDDVQVHTFSGAKGPYHRAVPECQNLSASPTHQLDESYTQPALVSLDIAMNFSDSSPMTQEDLHALREALRCVSEPSSLSYFDIHSSASPDLAESPVVTVQYLCLTDAKENAFQESLNPPNQHTATSQSQPSNI